MRGGVGRAACMVGHTWVGRDLTLGLVAWRDLGEPPSTMGSGGLRPCAISRGSGSRAVLHAGSLVCIYLYDISSHHFSDGASVDTNSSCHLVVRESILGEKHFFLHKGLLKISCLYVWHFF